VRQGFSALYTRVKFERGWDYEAWATRLWMKSTMSCVEVPGRKISAMPDFF